MDTPQNPLFITALIVSISVGCVLIFTIFTIIRAQRHYYRRKLLACITELDIQQRERIRIAADMHDDLGPLLTLILMQLETIAEKRADIAALISEARDNLQRLARRMHTITYNLDDKRILDNGLRESIRRFIEPYRLMHQLDIRFHYDIANALSGMQTLHLYRMVQELVHNTIRHAAAGHITIMMKQKNRTLFFYYKDDGHGLHTAGGGQGINNLYHRTELLGGHCRQETGEGLTYLFQVPL